MTPPPKREGPQPSAEDVKRWERYGQLVAACLYVERRDQYLMARDFHYNWVALDALADLMRDHRRLANGWAEADSYIGYLEKHGNL